MFNIYRGFATETTCEVESTCLYLQTFRGPQQLLEVVNRLGSTIWWASYFRPFKYWTNLLFRSPLYFKREGSVSIVTVILCNNFNRSVLLLSLKFGSELIVPPPLLKISLINDWKFFWKFKVLGFDKDFFHTLWFMFYQPKPFPISSGLIFFIKKDVYCRIH